MKPFPPHRSRRLPGLILMTLLLWASLPVTLGAEEPPAAQAAAPQEKGGAAKAVAVSSVEVYRNRQLLEKTIRDLDAFRVMIKFIREHKNDNGRLLLLEETDNYIDRHVDPLLENRLIYHPETLNLALTLEFYKAYIYFEADKQEKYLEVINRLKGRGEEKLSAIPIDPFGEKFKTLGEAVSALEKMLL